MFEGVRIREDAVLVEQERRASEGLIVVSRKFEEAAGGDNFGKVVMLGQENENFKVGDKIIFANFAGREFRWLWDEKGMVVEPGVVYLLMNVENILAVVENAIH